MIQQDQTTNTHYSTNTFQGSLGSQSPNFSHLMPHLPPHPTLHRRSS